MLHSGCAQCWLAIAPLLAIFSALRVSVRLKKEQEALEL